MAFLGGALSKALSTDNNSGDTEAQDGLIQRIGKAFKKLSSSKTVSPDSTEGNMADPSGYKKGGKVKKTGIAKVHKGERILNKKQARKYGPRKKA